jgi:hypothetical protein
MIQSARTARIGELALAAGGSPAAGHFFCGQKK